MATIKPTIGPGEVHQRDTLAADAAMAQATDVRMTAAPDRGGRHARPCHASAVSPTGAEYPFLAPVGDERDASDRHMFGVERGTQRWRLCPMPEPPSTAQSLLDQNVARNVNA